MLLLLVSLILKNCIISQINRYIIKRLKLRNTYYRKVCVSIQEVMINIESIILGTEY